LEIANLLVAKHCAVNAQDADGNTPLHLMAQKGNVELAYFLVTSGADPKIKNRKGKTPEEEAEAAENATLATYFKRIGAK
jgi:ankyrin repeat protein